MEAGVTARGSLGEMTSQTAPLQHFLEQNPTGAALAVYFLKLATLGKFFWEEEG